jgi:hypothetical protein
MCDVIFLSHTRPYVRFIAWFGYDVQLHLDLCMN